MINNRLKIIRKIGEGRSRVYLCTDLKLNETYAVKVLPPGLTDEEYAKFTEEYYILQKLNHPGLIKAYEHGTVLESSYEYIETGSRYIVLELFNGNVLSEIINLSEEQVRQIIIQIASVLQYLHLSNYIYYDLKPENILVFKESGKLSLKIIDLGFARLKDDNTDNNPRGTAEYIAPELLKNEPYDHRVDFYSLGILLYKLVYNTFPFDNSSELKIFRAQVEDTFRYPETKFSPCIIKVIQKLLEKDPASRYLSSVQIYADLEYNPDNDIISTWMPAAIFTDRKDVVNILNNYFLKYSTGDVFIIRGSEDSGKTAVLKDFSEKNSGTILIDNTRTRYGIEFLKDLLEKVFYCPEIFHSMDDVLRERIKNFLEETPSNLTEEYKGIFSQLTRIAGFNILIDDFNYLDELSIYVLKEVIPLLQVHNIKIVLAENSDRQSTSGFILNQHIINLSPFTEGQVHEYIEKSFYYYYPKEELKKLILVYADLLPGSIISFINDLLLFGIIKYTPEGIKVISDEKSIDVLKHSQEYFYKTRLSSLRKEELLVAEYLSAFRTLPDKSILPLLFHKTKFNPEEMLQALKTKNILHISGNLTRFSFTSEGLKNYIYRNIKNKRDIHLKNAAVLENCPPQNKTEIAYQYESASEFNRSLDYYMQLYEESASVDAYLYQKKLIEHILEFPLAQEKRQLLQFELCKVLYKTGDPAAALEHCEELLIYTSNPEVLNELLLFKGVCLIAAGKLEEGIKEIELLVEMLEDEERKKNLQTEIASAYLDLNKFESCENICREIISRGQNVNETTGKCYNLLGLTAIHRDNDIDKAYECFTFAETVYRSAGLKFRTAQMMMNQGNIKNIKEESTEAERLWRSSLELNSSIGNLQQEAVLLLNFGVLYFDKLDYEKSIANYKQALTIFSNTGDLRGEGLVNYNLGEIYFLSCDYKNALNCLNTARAVFQKVQDVNEELEAMFILGKLYYALGSSSDLNQLIGEFEQMLKTISGDKHNYNYRFLRILNNSDNLNFFHEVRDIINYFKKQSDRKNYFRASMTAVNFLLEHNLYKEAYEEIFNPDLLEATSSNNFHLAEWNLYAGQISRETDNPDMQPSEFFMKAYSLLEEHSISEVTWKCLSILADFYSSRGNSLKAEEYAYFAKSLLEHISDGIGDEKLVNTFLNSKEVKNSLSMCRKILLANG